MCFYSLHLYWKCVGIPPTTTLIVLSLFPHFNFTKVSEKRHKTQSCIFYFVPDYNIVQLYYKEMCQTIKKDIKRKGKSLKSYSMEIISMNSLMKILPKSSNFSGSLWNFQWEFACTLSLSLHFLGTIELKVGTNTEEPSSLSILQ